jgi:ankyrin repeat protein
MAHLNAAYQRVAASGCETYGDSGVTIYEKHYIHIKGSGFEPASIDHAVPGDKLIFIHSMEGFNSSAAAMAVVVVEGLASSGILQAQGDRFEVQLPPKSDTARVYLAYNALCSFMVTKIASTPPATVATYGHSSGDSLSVGLVGSAEANQRVRGERYADSFVYAAANNQIAIVRRRLGLPEEHVAAPIGDLSTRPCEPTTVAPTRHNSQLNSQLLSNGPAVTGPQRLPLVAHPDVLDADGCTALAAAARAGHVRVLSLLIEAGADLNARCLSHKANGGGGGPKGSTALCVAANWGQASSISCLLHYSADAAHIHITNDQDRTPLHLAALNGHYDAVRKTNK